MGDITGELKLPAAGDAGSEPDAIASSIPLVIGDSPSEEGVVGLDRKGLASSDVGSIRSGGRRSFSISDFLLSRIQPGGSDKSQ